jgi:2'-5' RNA ligase
MRLFIAAPLAPEIREALCANLARVRAALSRMPIKWVPPENLHLTFRFLGETPESDLDALTKRLRGVCLSFPPMEVRVAGLGCFPAPTAPKVIWVGLQSAPRLLKLHDAIQKATAEFGVKEKPGFAARRTPFTPHLTVGRVKDISAAERQQLGRELSRQTVGDVGGWRIEHVTLMESELSAAGSRYRELAAIPLLSP